MIIQYKSIEIDLKSFNEKDVLNSAIEFENKKFIKDREQDDMFDLISCQDEPLAGSGRKSFINFIETIK